LKKEERIREKRKTKRKELERKINETIANLYSIYKCNIVNDYSLLFLFFCMICVFRIASRDNNNKLQAAYGKGLVGTIPTEIGLLTSLTHLDLDGNIGITGTIPTQLGLLTQLTHLDLDQNTLTGTIPTELGLLSSALQVLELNNNQLWGTIPTELGLLTKLTLLSIHTNSELETRNLPPQVQQLITTNGLIIYQ
jgi:Leucine-rich repeat (LRR) protein